jgi:hypothetical protein
VAIGSGSLSPPTPLCSSCGGLSRSQASERP